VTAARTAGSIMDAAARAAADRRERDDRRSAASAPPPTTSALTRSGAPSSSLSPSPPPSYEEQLPAWAVVDVPDYDDAGAALDNSALGPPAAGQAGADSGSITRSPPRRTTMPSVVSLLTHVRSFGRPRKRQCRRCARDMDPKSGDNHCAQCRYDMRACAICSLDDPEMRSPSRAHVSKHAAAAGGTGVSDLEKVKLGFEPSLCSVCTARRPVLPPPSTSKRTKKNVLALDGGGLRGVFTLVILRTISQVAGRPIRDLFDLIVGCSAGGIIACGACACIARCSRLHV
jgi:hypothetical protein